MTNQQSMKFFTTLGALTFALFFTTTILAQTEQDIPFNDLPPTDEFGMYPDSRHLPKIIK